MRSYGKLLASAVIATAALIITALSASAYDYTGVGTVTGSVVNIRSEAGATASIVAQGLKSAKFKVVENGEGWSKIEYSLGNFGYISNDYFSVEAITKESCGGVITGSAVNVREGAGTEYNVIGVVYSGETVPVFGRENGWVKVGIGNSMGWVFGDYISTDGSVAPKEISAGQAIVNEAKKYLGRPYAYGGSGPNAFDCSGFTSYVYRQFGYSLNRTAASQTSHGVAVSRENLQPGDLIMFAGRSGGGIGHVAIYVGDGMMIHAGNTSTGVYISPVNSEYYGPRYVCARRIV
jgi:cell wall-associated NlpC family hydrolase